MSLESGKGLIVASHGSRGQLATDAGEIQRYVVKGRRLRVVCGDHVEWSGQKQSNELLVTAVQERVNALERPDARGRAELIAANLSRLVIVLAPEPEPDLFLADRFLCAAELMQADALVMWNKSDLCAAVPIDIEIYRHIGYRVLDGSATTGKNIDELATELADGVSMLVGQSGVGKSSLINHLLPNAEVTTANLSTATGEGRHTTTASVMHMLPGGGQLIDSPGVREFAPVIGEPGRVQNGFREIVKQAAECRFADCQHLREPDCAVKAAVETGAIDARRYESYKRLRNTVVAFEST
jgi:ribosome biogenesis GTPase